MKRIKYVYFYFLFLLYLIAGFFRDVPLIKKKIYENLYNYMGLMLIPTLLLLIFYGLIFTIENKKRRFFWELRLYYMHILFFILVYIFILSNLGITPTTASIVELNGDFIRNLINRSLFEYKIGYLPTYLLYEFINLSLRFEKIPFHYFYYGLYGLVFFLFLLMVFGPLIRSLNRFKERRKKERERIKAESKIREQIEIKEKLEKGEKVNTIKLENRSVKKNSPILKKRRKNKTEVGTKVDEEIQKSGIVLKKTVTIEDE